MRIIILLFSCFILFSCKDNTRGIQLPLKIDVTADIVTPQQYIVTKTAQSIIIDGKPNEESWQSALFTSSFIDIEGIKTPKFETKVKMLWDDRYLYIYAQMIEPHIWGDITDRDAVIYYNNDFEVFISPSGTTRNYGEIEINSLGTEWDLLLDKPYRDGGKYNNHWNLDSLKSAVHIEGSLNDHSDIDSLWSVEMAIPMDALLELKNRPKDLPTEGEQWRLNFSRVEWDHDIVNGVYQRKKLEDGKYQSEYNWVWSNQKVINMHEPEKWGVLQFTDHLTTENIDVVADDNILITQVAFALLRQTRGGKLKPLLKEEIGYTRTLEVRYNDKNPLQAIFYRTNFGYEYKLSFQSEGRTILINQSGDLKIRK